METSLSRVQAQPSFELENQPTFNVVTVYEDFAAGKHAKETYDYLVHQLGRDYEFTNQMWKFDVLGNAKMREMAAKDATEADLIIISSHGIGELSEEVKAWVEQWVERRTSAMALVALVDRPAGGEIGGPDSISAYLQRAAHSAQIEFFTQQHDWPEREDDFSVQQIAERAERTSNVMADFIHQHGTSVHSAAILPPKISRTRWGNDE
jgi:hypothetical protein